MPFGLVAVFGEDFRVSDMTAKANWALTDCVASSSNAQTVNAYCTDTSHDSRCNAVFKKRAKDTYVGLLPLLCVSEFVLFGRIVKMPTGCGAGPYARVVGLEENRGAKIPNSIIKRSVNTPKALVSALI
jgi:hypothetical protein